ncbi:hypothetical protein [Dyadobacter sandarakinus]|uniref:Uncharacterized protein n=1 Tax=Dyadobacter sandarakinus TaxID=2747268 RepID=A0ABX7I3C8_9BACT|nr:hypothetical protein [Dyadobacter sandarakinus]QRQ99540.1 hypothetical protein HWI92_00730 [Dyadobacter sandarakinus]
MKRLQIWIIAALLAAPALTMAQTSSQSSYQKKTRRTSVTKDTSDVSAILKDTVNQETGPILNDNGTVSSSGTVDGSRSSTGRKDVDSTTSYSVKRTKKTMKAERKNP